MRQLWTGRAVFCGFFLVIISAAVFAQSDGALQKQLDKPISIIVQNEPIEQVFERIAKTAGTQFSISPDTFAVLPYGRETCLDVEISKTPLRLALPRVLYPQGLSWIIKGDVITIVPSEPLYRMTRRATYDELEILGKLLTKSIEKTDYDSNKTPAENILIMLRAATGDKNLKILFSSLNNEQIVEAQNRNELTLPTTAVKWLDSFCKICGQTWYLDGATIVLLTENEQAKRQLQRHVSLKLKNARLMNVLLGLAAVGRVPIKMEPGMMNQLPQEVRENFTLIIDDATIDQALQVISGTTGLEFTVSESSLFARVSPRSKMADDVKSRKPRRADFLIRTSIPTSSGRDLEFYIFPEDLPEDVRKALDIERKKAIEELKRSYLDSPKPSD